jgi:hypothetical protein
LKDLSKTNKALPYRISGLEEILRQAAVSGNAPVERWDPPYCGDIGLAIGPDAAWTYRGSPITRVSLVKLFARVLRRDADGRTYLVTPAEKIDVTVADAPFLAVEMEVHGEGAAQQLIFRTNVDDIVTAGPEHPISFALQEAGGLKPYVRVRGRLDALVSRAVTYDLLELIAGNENGGEAGIWSGGGFFAVPSAAAN